MHLVQEIRQALRTLRGAPAMSTLIVVTLALGIAANGFFFTSVYTSAFRPLPFADPDRLVMLHQSRPSLGESRLAVSPLNLRDWTERSTAFLSVGAYADRNYDLIEGSEPARVLGAAVSAELFPLLGVEPALGRNLAPAEDRVDGPRTALLSHDLWVERYARDPAILGKTVRIGRVPHEVVGVMPQGFAFPNFARLWTPLRLEPDATDRADNHLLVIARLRDEVTVAQARSSLEGIAAELAALHPETNADSGAETYVLREAWLPLGATGAIAGAAQLVLFVGLLLVICANVTSIVLAQATARRGEWALRQALGAGRRRIVRQVLLESCILALAGGAIGAAVAWRSEAIIKSVVLTPIPFWFDLSLDIRGLAYIVGVTLLAGVAIGVLPALRASRLGLTGSLSSGGAGTSAGKRRLEGALVVGEYAVALVILVQGLLMVLSFQNLRDTNRGFAADTVLTFQLPLDGPQFEDATARAQLIQDATRSLEALPSTTGAGTVNVLPYLQVLSPAITPLQAVGTELRDEEAPQAAHHMVDRGFFDAFGVPVVSGRRFTQSEVQGGADIALLSVSAAEALWPGQDAVGRTLRAGTEGNSTELRVVGTVGDIEPGQMIPGVGSMPRHRIYLPLGGTSTPSNFSGPPRFPTVVVATSAPPGSVAGDARRVLQELDPTLPLVAMRPMREVLDHFFFAHHFWNRVFSAISVMTLLIAGVGVYGITRHAAMRRAHEMAIRLALGAEPRQLAGLVMRRSFVLALVGCVLGILAATPMAFAMEAMVHEAAGLQPRVLLTVFATLVGLGLVASLAPAWRSSAPDPAARLRSD